MDKAELTSFARAFQKPVPKGQKAPANTDNVDKILAAMDFDDADGKIQLEEFETYLEVPLCPLPQHAERWPAGGARSEVWRV